MFLEVVLPMVVDAAIGASLVVNEVLYWWNQLCFFCFVGAAISAYIARLITLGRGGGIYYIPAANWSGSVRFSLLRT